MTHACKPILDHLNRLEGQLRALRRFVEQGESCEDVAQLTSAVSRSFDSLKSKILQSFLEERILEGRSISPRQQKELEALMKVVKS